MSKEELVYLQGLPNMITIYRGMTEVESKSGNYGISWTLNWGKTIADAILDRIVHDAHRVELRGESLRKTREKQKNMEMMN